MRVEVLQRAVLTCAAALAMAVAAAAPAAAAPPDHPDKKPSHGSSPSPSASPSPTSSARVTTASATRAASPSPSPSPSPSATSSSNAAPPPPGHAKQGNAPKGKAKGHDRGAAPATTAPRAAPAKPSFIGPVARVARPLAPPPFVGPVAPRHHRRHHAISGQTVPLAATAPHAAAPARPVIVPKAVGLLPGSDVGPVVKSLVKSSVGHPQAPVGLAVVVLLFLLIQHRIDRRDPKLARVTAAEPDLLEFGSAVRLA